MSRFEFSLQRLLNLRASAERLQALIMQRAAAAEAAQRDRSQDSVASLDRAEAQAQAVSIAPAGVRQAMELATEAARRQAEAANDALRAAESDREREEGRFTEARMARRALERLRERKAADWSMMEARAEQATSDETARRLHGEEEA